MRLDRRVSERKKLTRWSHLGATGLGLIERYSDDPVSESRTRHYGQESSIGESANWMRTGEVEKKSEKMDRSALAVRIQGKWAWGKPIKVKLWA
jgi:hypothetical protein